MSNLIDTIFNADGETVRLFRDTDWTKTPLGSIDEWRDELAICVSLCLNSRFPLILWWGPELTFLYNDPYTEHLQSKHPWAFSRSGREVWSEIWPIIGPMIESVLETGNATWSDDLKLYLERNGYPEETYHTFSYSAIKDRTGQILGVFTPVNETTQKVISSRRLDTLKNIGSTKSEEESELCRMLSEILSSNRSDLPFAALLQVDQAESSTILVNDSSFDLNEERLMSFIQEEVLDACKAGELIVRDTKHILEASKFRSEREFVAKNYVLAPIPGPKLSDSFVLIAGVSPHIPLDDSYKLFYSNVARELSAAIREVRALEYEKRQARALLELDRAKTVFFNNISHEFRTPLTLMLGPLESLLGNAKQITQEEKSDAAELRTLHRNLLRLLKLVNTLLDFSRIEAGRYEATFVPTDIGEFTADLASLFRSSIEKAGLTFNVDCGSIKQLAYLDRDMWEKIVLNLISNAFKFTLKGSITVNLSESESAFRLSVRDTGIGIPNEELQNIFQRFHRLKSDGARSHEGSGIGLAIVNEMVRLHNGEIEIQSELGFGTEISIALPKGAEHLPKEQIGDQAPVSEIRNAQAFVFEANNWLRGESQCGPDDEHIAQEKSEQKILIVDDNADMRDYLVRLLAPLWTVRTASNGQEALELIAQESPDLIITDIMMPGIHGLELLDRVRQSEESKNIPVLLLSAKAGEEAKAGGIEAGADDYLVKPFSARELYARTARLMERRSFAQTLEHAVQLRTEQLESALEAKSRFLSTVSHEVRTPMAGIIGLVELITLTADDELKTMSNMALDSCKRLLQILNNLLEASKLQTGDTKLEPRFFSIRPVVGDVVQLVAPEANKKKIEVISGVDANVPDRICGDELRVRQILQNLVFNAVKFTNQGSVKVQVSLEEQNDVTAIIKLTVQDTGIGIEASQQEKIFEPFVQARSATASVRAGTGLGLNICRALVALMGGEMGVTSQVGVGSTFWVTIPFRDDQCQPE